MSGFFRRPLLATEHTKFDTGAETVALELAQRIKSPLAVVLPLQSNSEYEALMPQIAAREEHNAAFKITQLRALASAAGVELDLHLRRGEEPYREIVKEAGERGSDLIVIRRIGERSFLAKLLVGEMVRKVVAHARCPVLIVDQGSRLFGQRVLVAAEPGALGLRLVGTAASLAAQHDLPLHVVCVAPEDAQRQPAEAFLAKALYLSTQQGASAQTEARVGKPATEILESAKQCGADLIVIGSRGDGRIGRAFVGGVTQKIMGLSATLVLVVHPEGASKQAGP